MEGNGQHFRNHDPKVKVKTEKVSIYDGVPSTVLLLLSSWCILTVSDLRLFLIMPWVCLSAVCECGIS